MAAQSQDSNPPTEDLLTERIIHLESAIKSKQASFPHVVEAWYLHQETFNNQESLRNAYKKYYEPILQAFESTHGTTRKIYRCQSSIAAAILTEKDRVYSVYGLDFPELADWYLIISECEHLCNEAVRFLNGRDQSICIEKFFAIICQVLRALDNYKVAVEKHENAVSMLELLKTEVDRARNNYLQCTQRRAQLHYFYGMLCGFGIMALAGLCIALIMRSVTTTELTTMNILGSYLAGGVGAIVSVMSRMTFGKIELQHDAGKAIPLLGAFRPIMGAIFGIAIYFLLMGNLLPVNISVDASKQFYLFMSIAFIAGFSERWAQDMLVVAQGSLTRRKEESSRKAIKAKRN